LGLGLIQVVFVVVLFALLFAAHCAVLLSIGTARFSYLAGLETAQTSLMGGAASTAQVIVSVNGAYSLMGE